MSRWNDREQDYYSRPTASYYPPPVIVDYGPLRNKLKFSKKELQQLFIAGTVLTLAFAFALSGATTTGNWAVLPLFIGISAIVVLTAFVLHELGHKFVAQKYGCWAEFRAWNMGLVFALIGGLLGFVFAAPGAVYIAGRVSKEENGKISIAGPAMNLVLGSGFFAGLIGYTYALTGEFSLLWWKIVGYYTIPGLVLYLGAYINFFLAVFNLLPIPPLDGSKIVRWNIPVYIVTLIVAIGLLVPFFL